jgi:hypothetical protein
MTAEKMNEELAGCTYDQCADDAEYGTAVLFTSDAATSKKIVVVDGELAVVDQ